MRNKAKRPSVEKRDNEREVSRRSLIKWTVAGAAALGLQPWRAFEILEKSGGVALAQDAAKRRTKYVIAINSGNGGLANWTLLWPYRGVAQGGNANAALHAIGQYRAVPGSNLLVPPETIGRNAEVSTFVAATNETHTSTPASNNIVSAGNNLLPALASLQSTNSTLVPVIRIGTGSYGAAAGAPQAAVVPDAAGLAGLFNSRASSAGGLLQNSRDAEVYAASLKAAFMLNNAGAKRPGLTRAFNTVKGAGTLLGTNLADRIAFNADDAALYGVTGNVPTQLRNMAMGLCSAVKAIEAGMTSLVQVSGPQDDPHNLFAGGAAAVNTKVAQMAAIMNGFFAHLEKAVAPDGSRMIDALVWMVTGDTPKLALNRGGWPDNSPGNSNFIAAWDSKWLKKGQFGDISAAGQVTGFDGASGGPAAFNNNATASAMAGAILYAVSEGDERAAEAFRPGEYRGLVNANTGV